MAQTVTLRPSGRGLITGLMDNPSSGANWEKVDEVSSDGDTTYVFLFDSLGFGTTGIDLYLVQSISPLGEAKTITVNVEGRQAVGGTNTIAPVLRINGSTRQGTTSALTGSYTTYSHSFTPLEEVWTEASVDALEIGVRMDTDANLVSGAVRCTRVWAVVTYEKPTYLLSIPSGSKVSIGSGYKLTLGQTA